MRASEMDLEDTLRTEVEAAGLELVEVVFQRQQGRRVLRVTVDREGGVDLDAVAAASERISARLDDEGFRPGPYDLQVSSPGLERPLKRPSDFARSLGERVRVRTARPLEGSRTLEGTLLEARDDEVRIAIGEGERTVRYDEISSARTVFEWGGGDGRGEAR